MDDWVEHVCRVPLTYRAGDDTLKELFGAVRAHLADGDAFVATVRAYLAEHPDLVEVWGTYSADKRTGRGPYFDDRALVVGFADYGSTSDVRRFDDAAEACADFVYREGLWALKV